MELQTIHLFTGYILAGFFFILSAVFGYLWTKKSRAARIAGQNYALSQQSRANIEESYFKNKDELERIQKQIDENNRAVFEAQKSEVAAKEYLPHLQKQIEGLTNKLGQSEQIAKENHEAKTKAQADMRAAQEILEAERKVLEDAKNKFQETFKGLAASALEGNNQHFLDLAKQFFKAQSEGIKSDMTQKQQSLEEKINPLNKHLERYQALLHEIELERQKSYQSIETELKKVLETGSSLSQETRALKDALKKPHIRGRWGEIQLKNCVELAGMSEHCDFTLQDSKESSDGGQLRPDCTVKMPGGRVVIIDSKTPTDGFFASLEASTDTERSAELARHGRHVKEHIQQLSKKAYQEQFSNSADFTVMFIPNESFLYAALEKESDVIEYALQKKILIATPPTFVGLLKVIRYGWNEDKLARNAREISQSGQELHKRLVDFVEAFENIGKNLERAKEEYDKGKTRLSSRVLVQARRMEALGVKGRKDLPESMGYDNQLFEVIETTDNQTANDNLLTEQTDSGNLLLDNSLES